MTVFTIKRSLNQHKNKTKILKFLCCLRSSSSSQLFIGVIVFGILGMIGSIYYFYSIETIIANKQNNHDDDNDPGTKWNAMMIGLTKHNNDNKKYKKKSSSMNNYSMKKGSHVEKCYQKNQQRIQYENEQLKLLLLSTSSRHLQQVQLLLASRKNDSNPLTAIADSSDTTTTNATIATSTSHVDDASNDSDKFVFDDPYYLPLEHNNDNNNNSNQTLTILIGTLRGGEEAWESLYRNVLDVNDADLALLTNYNPYDKNDHNHNNNSKYNSNTYPYNSSLYKRAKYIWTTQEPNSTLNENDSNNYWGTLIDQMIENDPIIRQQQQQLNNNNTNRKTKQRKQRQHPAYTWRTDIMERNKNTTGLFGPIDNRTGSGSIIFLMRIQLQQIIRQLNLISKYKRFIITRSDHYYLCSHNISQLLPPIVQPVQPQQSLQGSTGNNDTTINNPNLLASISRKYIWTPGKHGKKKKKNKQKNNKIRSTSRTDNDDQITTTTGVDSNDDDDDDDRHGKEEEDNDDEDDDDEFTGITDRHVVVTNRYVLHVLDIFPSLFRHFGQYNNPNIIPNSNFRYRYANPEQLIKHVWSMKCMYPYITATFPRMMFTVGRVDPTVATTTTRASTNTSMSRNGSSQAYSSDSTRWKPYGKYIPRYNVVLKYEKEFHSAKQYCQSQQQQQKTKEMSA